MKKNKNEIAIFNNQNNSKERYRRLCKNRADIPLFMQAWWLDAVCIPENKKWDVFIVEENEEIIGAMPYHWMRKYVFKLILLPIHTQYNGIWMNYPDKQSESQRLSFEKTVMTRIINQIEKMEISFFQQNFHYNITNWQPFYWRNFNQTTRYTYILKNIANTENIFQNFHSLKQKHIKKAQRDLHVDFQTSADDFYKFHTDSLMINNKKLFYSEKLFKNIHAVASERHQAKIIAIRDSSNNLHSAAYLVWDHQSSYYLISAINPKYKSSGASSLMVWEAISFLADKTQIFDFEGSMIENVAKSFEEFGAEQKPYFVISKYNLLFHIYMYFRKS